MKAANDNFPTTKRGFSREDAAAYIGVSVSKFDEMRSDGRIGAAKKIDARLVWNIRRLDAAFDALPDEGAASEDWQVAV